MRSLLGEIERVIADKRNKLDCSWEPAHSFQRGRLEGMIEGLKIVAELIRASENFLK